MHGVQSLVNLVKQVEWGGIALLDGEDECEGNQGLLPPRQLLHVAHLSFVAREGDLARTHTTRLIGDIGAFIIPRE